MNAFDLQALHKRLFYYIQGLTIVFVKVDPTKRIRLNKVFQGLFSSVLLSTVLCSDKLYLLEPSRWQGNSRIGRIMWPQIWASRIFFFSSDNLCEQKRIYMFFNNRVGQIICTSMTRQLLSFDCQ